MTLCNKIPAEKLSKVFLSAVLIPNHSSPVAGPRAITRRKFGLSLGEGAVTPFLNGIQRGEIQLISAEWKLHAVGFIFRN